MTDTDRAERLGSLAARANRPVTACPFDANGTLQQRVLARRFVRGYVSVAPGAVDTTST
jgi:hypothetical protein